MTTPVEGTTKKKNPNGLPAVVQEIVLIAITTVTVVSGILTLFLHKDFGLSAHEGAYAALFSTMAVIGYSIYLAAKKHQPLDPTTLGAEILELLKEILVIVPKAMEVERERIRQECFNEMRTQGMLRDLSGDDAEPPGIDPANVRHGTVSTTRSARTRKTTTKRTGGSS